MNDRPRTLPGLWHIEYQYSIGEMASLFFTRLEGGVITGARCQQCARVSVPPKSFCEYCFCKITDTVEVELQGEIQAATVVTAAFPGSPPVPYCIAYVKLDGATSAIANFVRGVELSPDGTLPESIRVGSSVSVVFSDEREGRITDFWFEPKGQVAA